LVYCLGASKLTEVINYDILQEVQDKFSMATGLGAVIADREGNPITKFSRFTDYCTIIRSSPKGLARCKVSDAGLGKVAYSSGKPEMHCCHAGLIDIAAPLIVNGTFLGSVLCGQVLIEDVCPMEDSCFEKLADELDVDPEELIREKQKIPTIPRRQVEAAADLLQIMANYIVGIGIAAVNERIINEKNIKIMEQQKTRIELEKSLRASELKALQSQVNPHFLFNTLNSIARLAMLEEAFKTQEVVISLADMLRYNLRTLGQLVPLCEEIDHIQAYLQIQKTRFGDRMNYKAEISEEVVRFEIPIMTLQPLVENALVYGLEPKVAGGTIEVMAYAEGDYVVINLKDDGMGMSKERLERVRMLEENFSRKGHTTGIGLPNVFKRLTHHFGSRCQILLDSKLNEGTQITILIPRDAHKEANNV